MAARCMGTTLNVNSSMFEKRSRTSILRRLVPSTPHVLSGYIYISQSLVQNSQGWIRDVQQVHVQSCAHPTQSWEGDTQSQIEWVDFECVQIRQNYFLSQHRRRPARICTCEAALFEWFAIQSAFWVYTIEYIILCFHLMNHIRAVGPIPPILQLEIPPSPYTPSKPTRPCPILW